MKIIKKTTKCKLIDVDYKVNWLGKVKAVELTYECKTKLKLKKVKKYGTVRQATLNTLYNSL